MFQLPFWAHNLIYCIKLFLWGSAVSSLYKKWQSNGIICKTVNNVCICICTCMDICIHIWERERDFFPFPWYLFSKIRVKASFSSKWHKEHVQKNMKSFPKLYSCVVLKKHLNVYSKCEMEKSKATITLRFTVFMESNTLKYEIKTVFQKCKTWP